MRYAGGRQRRPLSKSSSRRHEENQPVDAQRSKLSQKKQRLAELYVDGILSRAEFDRRREEIDAKLADLVPAPELPAFETDFSAMYEKLSLEKKAVFWRAFLASVTVDRDRNVSLAYNTAKVLAERLAMLLDALRARDLAVWFQRINDIRIPRKTEIWEKVGYAIETR